MNKENIFVKFTKREKQIIKILMKEVCSRKVLAAMLVLSISTIDAHMRSIHQKTNTHNTAGVVKFAFENPSTLL